MNKNIVADGLSAIRNAVRHGKKEVNIKGISKLLVNILDIMKREGYLENYEVVSEERGGELKVTLGDKINECRAIVPRFFVKKDGYLDIEKQYLPAVGMGIIIVSTSKGVMTHEEARGKYGGALLAYVY